MRLTLQAICSLVILGSFLACDPSATPKESPASLSPGQRIYQANCELCHGKAGNLGVAGAADLTRSELDFAAMVDIVTHGRNQMVPYQGVLTPEEIEEVVTYARTLHADS